MPFLVEALISLLLIAGGVFVFIGSLGMAHLRDFYMRLHGPTKATTLGIGCMLIASMGYFWSADGKPDIQELLITLFLFITAPSKRSPAGQNRLAYAVKAQPKNPGQTGRVAP
mgnify:CR=1 FL=1